MTRSPWFYAALGLLVGTLGTAGALLADGPKKAEAPAEAAAPFDIVDTPGSTYLLNRATGQVWRVSFTDVRGNKYWYALHVPVQQPGTFEDFQVKIRKELAGGN